MCKGYIEQLRLELAEQEPLYADYVRWLPELLDFFTALLEDLRLPSKPRVWINAAVAYAVLPFDAMPESAMGAFGYLDDLYVCAEVLRLLILDAEAAPIVGELWGHDRPCSELTSDILDQCQQALSDQDRHTALALVGLDMAIA